MRAQSKVDHRLYVIAAAAAVGLLSSAAPTIAATSTATFTVQVTVVATCTINSASTLNFGSQGVFTANVDQTSTIQVQCTNTTPYTIGLDAGLGSGATVAVRKMTSGGATVNYTLYSDSGRTTVWGTTIGTNTVAATGNGAAQSYTVYGRIPAQTTPAPGSYADTVTVTVTY
ncbi:MAG TPA: spore coat U domain-containing protein [Xanthobacteraceae bacterium]|jgi:spore coat protein U-like protein|nr:spore coat U domain-containing protein [Xanthobacteraceae bacterium]